MTARNAKQIALAARVVFEIEVRDAGGTIRHAFTTIGYRNERRGAQLRAAQLAVQTLRKGRIIMRRRPLDRSAT